MYSPGLTAGVTVSGPPPRAPVGPAALQVAPGPLWGSGAATWRRDSHKACTHGTASGVRTPSSGKGSGPPRGTQAGLGVPDPPFPQGKGSDPPRDGQEATTRLALPHVLWQQGFPGTPAQPPH
jgi:hypothetical protein